MAHVDLGDSNSFTHERLRAAHEKAGSLLGLLVNSRCNPAVSKLIKLQASSCITSKVVKQVPGCT